ncbi:bifunctional 4-hydroxy-2-oxoglutarate aldolase/2-dehydro-3-deoxy-phosphogluconate aldolase [Salinibacterium sp. NK8237]|uniref:bifunctional 4-hydroxy-2-oxoglutarate aldolase/2-dehydro-3-deoxy-phosphogluconate aldolase n=1 Tax=Salinibacterium sp. NK8237 TaxID=2792038 RepID=UPI0018CD2762|nr:bifunctional 4-hydroxy-2-oxoglutarate aldolase/2-dehydro-3-deoxy-phosphogluconate aldolase [Salinibacterium sp. NK8237]MBH0130195.1 bifunctional 4-hydroxy-2-oxoglutarate aldolase/2-dehydro-3-deoxy-phosphogluconate aldolase [Salinibacterium sp. NK8237]
MTDRLHRLRESAVLAVLRAPSAEIALDASEALIRNGILGIEVTYSTPDAAAVIAELVRRHGDAAYIGAGTVTTAEQAQAAAGAGAQFLVSPGTSAPLATAMIDTGLVVMTGALTPSEVMEAVDLGVDVVKIFPASLGGPSYLGALRGPFPEVPLMPTGGVNPDNVADWFAAGAIAVGAGGDLVPSSALTSGDFTEIEVRAKRFLAAVAAVRAGASA